MYVSPYDTQISPLTIVQSKQQSANANNPVFSFPSVPTNGNLLLLFLACQGGIPNNPGLAGWTQINTWLTGSTTLTAFYKIAANETNNYTWGWATGHYYGVTAIEINGQYSTPVNGNSTSAGTSAAVTTTAITPSTLGCLPIFCACDGGSITLVGGSLTAGYSLITNTSTAAIPNMLYQGPVTADTSTPVNPGFAFTASQTWATSLLLIAPNVTTTATTTLSGGAFGVNEEVDTTQGPDSAWDIRSVNSGANPDNFNFSPPPNIPQSVPKGAATGNMLGAFFTQPRRRA